MRRDAVLMLAGIFLFAAMLLWTLRDAGEDAQLRRWVAANRWKVESYDDLFRGNSKPWEPGTAPYKATDNPLAELPDFYRVPTEALDRRHAWEQRVGVDPWATAPERRHELQ